MIKSPLRYPGGKSRAAKFLYQYFPSYIEFREPFFGGGSVSFYCTQKNPQSRYYANDINYDLICFWKAVKYQIDELIDAVSKIKDLNTVGKNLFYEILQRRDTNLSDFQRAVDFFLLNRITFSGVVDSGGYSEQSFHKRFTYSSIQRLRTSHSIVKNISFTSSDYLELLLRQGNDVFIFLDPPYYSTTKSKLYGKKGSLHTTFDHEKFRQNISFCNHKWLITYDNSEYIRDLFSEYHLIEWNLQYGMNNYKQDTASKGNELLITNYDINTKKYFQLPFFGTSK